MKLHVYSLCINISSILMISTGCYHIFRSKITSQQLISRLMTNSPSNMIPQPFRSLSTKKIARVAATLLSSLMVMSSVGAARESYPFYGQESIMSRKAHGTSEHAVQKSLRWGCDEKTADKISNYNRHWAEHSGYFTSSKLSFMADIQAKAASKSTEPTIFYDSVTGKPLFQAPTGRSYDAFLSESISHGWPSFRDNEVIWENVRVLPGGETVSLTGTHLGHNLPDRRGNRYCINLVSVSGNPR